MSLQEQLQQWSDDFFAQLEAEYKHRPLVQAIIGKIKRSVDAEIPKLVQQGMDAASAVLIDVVDKEFSRLIADVAAVPYLADLLRDMNRWIDQEIHQLWLNWAQK